MAWFSRSGLTSLTGQLTEQLSTFTKEVLTEGDEEDQPSPAPSNDDLINSRRRVDDLECTTSKLREETIRYKKQALENAEKLKVAEEQVSRVCSEYDSVILDKQRQIRDLQAQVERLSSEHRSSEQDEIVASLTPTDWNDDSYTEFSWTNDTPPVDPDSSRPRRKSHSLCKDEELRAQLESMRETHERQLTALEDHYENRIAALVQQHSALPVHPVAPEDFDPDKYHALEEYCNSQLNSSLPKLAEHITNLCNECRVLRLEASPLAVACNSDNDSRGSGNSWAMVSQSSDKLSPSTNESQTVGHDAHTLKRTAPSWFEISELDLETVSEIGLDMVTLTKVSEELQVTNILSVLSYLLSERATVGGNSCSSRDLHVDEREAQTEHVDCQCSLLRAENEELARRLSDVATALDQADSQLKRIEDEERGNFTSPELAAESSWIEAGTCGNEMQGLLADLADTKDLLNESLSSNRQMNQVVEDQSLFVSRLQSENAGLADRNRELLERIQALEEQLRDTADSLKQRISSRDENESANRHSSAEQQLAIITDLQAEVSRFISFNRRLRLANGTGSGAPETSETTECEPSSRKLLQRALLDKEEQIVKQNIQIDHLKSQLNSVQSQTAPRIETHAELCALREELSSLHQLLEEQRQQLSRKDSEMSDARDVHAEEKLLLEKTIEGLNATLQQLQPSNARSPRKPNLQIEEVDLWNTEGGEDDRETHVGAELLETLESLRLEKENQENGLRALELENCRLSDQVDDMREESAVLVDRLEALTNRNRHLEDRQQVLEKEIERLKSVESNWASDKESDLHNLDLRVDELQRELHESRAQKEEMQQKIDVLLGKLNEASAENSNYGQQLVKIADDLATTINEKFDLSTKLAEIKEEKDNLLAEVENLKAQQSIYEKRVSELQHELEYSQSMVSNLTQELETIVNSKVDPRETAILDDEIHRLRDGVDQQKQKIVALEQELETAREQCRALETEIADKRSRIETVNTHFNELCAVLDQHFPNEDMHEISVIVDFYRTELERLQSDARNFERLCAEKDVRISADARTLEDLRLSFGSLQEEYDNARANFARANEAMESLRLEKEAALAQLEDARRLHMNLESQLREKSEESSRLQGKLDHSVGELAENQTIISDLERQLLDIEARHEKQTQSSASLQHEVEVLRESQSSQLSTINTQKHQLEELKSLVVTYEKQLDEATQDYSDVKQRYNSLSSQVAGNSRALEDEISHLKHINGQLQRDNDDLRNQMSSLNEECERLQQRLTSVLSEVESKDDLLTAKKKEAAALTQRLLALEQSASQSKSSSEGVEAQLSQKTTALNEANAELIMLRQKTEELERQSRALSEKNSSLVSIMDENEGEWQAKLEQQKSEMEQISQQAYTIRSHYDQLLNAYNHKAQQVVELENRVDAMNAEMSHLSYQLEESSANPAVSAPIPPFDEYASYVQEEPVNASSVVSSQQTPDLLQSAPPQETKSSGQELELELQQVNAELQHARQQLQLKEDQCHTLQDELAEISSRKKKLGEELNRLREHMIAMEEGYTQEALSSEEREKALRTRLYEVETKLEKAAQLSSESSMGLADDYEEARAQVESLTSQRRLLEDQLAHSNEEVRLYKHAAENLQLVTQQLQRDKDEEIRDAVKSYKKRFQEGEKERARLQSELQKLEVKVDEQEKLLEQAAHLNSELELREEEIERLNEQIKSHDATVASWKAKVEEISAGDRVEKQLVRNLLIAYLTVPTAQKQQALSMISSFLEFSAEDRDRVGLGSNRSWFGGWGFSPGQQQVGGSSQDSFTKKFIDFLEQESTKPTVVSLPHHHMNPASSNSVQHSPASSTDSYSSRTPSSHGGFNPFSPTVLPHFSAEAQDTTSPPKVVHSTTSDDALPNRTKPTSFLKELLKDD